MSQNDWGGGPPQPQFGQQPQPQPQQQPQGWQAPVPQGSPGGAPGMPDDKERMWGMLAHLSPLIVGFIGPLIIMLMPESLVGHPSAFVKHHAKQSLIWSIALLVITMVTCGLGIILIVWQIIAGLAANKGEWYVYPGLSSFVDK